MDSQIRLGRIFGIEIGLHYSWFIIALLITLSLAEHFYQTNPAWGRGLSWALAVLTALLFFAAIVAHELAHSVVAKTRGLPVRSITLFALGGVSRIEKESPDAKTEFWMAVAGPIASAVAGLLFLGLAVAGDWKPLATPTTPAMAMLVWLGYINLMLAAFNLIPGYPLDGGRVLRAIVWWVTGNAARSTRIAARAGQVVAMAFIAIGLLQFFGGAGLGGLWIAFIGWFLLDAARATFAQSEITERLGGLRVGDVMTRDCPVIDGRTNLQSFADEHLLRTGQRCFIVADNGVLAGLITAHEVKQVERRKWPFTLVDDVMRPLDQLRTVGAEAAVIEALEVMGREDVNQLPVVSNGRLDGIITRAHILQLLQTRSELRV
ncbi:MAG TPA: site-2 protease family protein [Blastocatellia bacterium]|nr:site-2 protease family protein [Blastocatellia bacterium]